MMASDYGAGVYSPLATVGPDDHGGYVLVAAYILLSLEVMAVVTRLTIRLVRLDDGFIFAALVSVMYAASYTDKTIES